MTKEMPKFISVTREDIMKGKAGDLSFCPVARAAKRSGFKNVLVGGSLRGEWKGLQYRFELPKTVSRFINRFDGTTNKSQRKELKPFSFRVRQ